MENIIVSFYCEQMSMKSIIVFYETSVSNFFEVL